MLQIAIPEKTEIARILAEAHRKFDPGINRIVRVISEQEHESGEPVKLLEVNPETSPSGIVPIVLGPYPPMVPYPSVVIEVTEEEFENINDGTLVLPDGWKLGELLYEPAAVL